MAIYSERGISLTFDGDLQIGANGDLKLDNAYETQKSSINWFFRTNKGDYVPDKRLGCDVGTFIGENIESDIISQIQNSTLSNLVKFAIARQDLRVDAVPIDHETIGVFLSIGGRYLGTDGKLLDPGIEILTYTFPFLEGQPTPLP